MNELTYKKANGEFATPVKKYEYDIETDKGTLTFEGINRNQAANKAKEQGYEVYSVNMVGHY